jgi:transketolase
MRELRFVPREQFQALLDLDAPAPAKAGAFALLCRINTLYMVARAGSGHLGSSFSSLDIVSWLYLNEIRPARDGGRHPFRDLYFSSKGHDVPGLYSVLAGLGVVDFDLIHGLRRLGGLPGHPDVSIPGIVTNTGSLGMGVSKAKGMILGHRLKGEEGRVFVMCGDGELQEGQFWESLISAANHRMHELTVIVDHNKIQSDVWVSKTSCLGDLEAKLRAFDWRVSRCDGHDFSRLGEALSGGVAAGDRPHAVIADTVKGCGVSFMRHRAAEDQAALYPFHSGAPSEDQYALALEELAGGAGKAFSDLGLGGLRLESPTPARSSVARGRLERLVDDYASALVEQALKCPDLVVLDADLKLDCGLIPFEDRFPHRFVECGIAEQDMVSTAGGLALEGKLPVVHSFACFLSARPNEQIYNNATERTRIIYAGFLAGLLPGGPGHSHQSVRDISALAAVPGLYMIQPCCGEELSKALDWCVNECVCSSYLRILQIPFEKSFTLPDDYEFVPGRGVTLKNGLDAAVIAYGPFMVEQAWKAALSLESRGVSLRVINLPWLNMVDRDWLMKSLEGCPLVFTVDDHYIKGGQGEMIAAYIAESKSGISVKRFGVDEIPVCGTNEEVIRYHGLDSEILESRILEMLEN